MTVTEAIYKRRAVKAFDPTVEITDEQLKTLIETTRQAPSSFNLQHVNFILLKDHALRKQILPLALNQEQLVQASVAVLMIGDPSVYKTNPGYVWRNAPQPVADFMVGLIGPFHEGREQLQRDEVMRSIGLASMTLMLAAVEMGFETCPMIGFDHEKVGELLGVPTHYAIGNMVLIGKGTKEPWPKPGFRDADDVVFLDGFGKSAGL